MTIEENIKARATAQPIIKAAMEAVKSVKGISENRFWEVLAELAASKCGREVVVPDAASVMTYDEALEFEGTTVPYGIHAGQLVRDVPAHYWAHITGSEWSKGLDKYVKSARFRTCLDREEEED